jgi:hypothetical protein
MELLSSKVSLVTSLDTSEPTRKNSSPYWPCESPKKYAREGPVSTYYHSLCDTFLRLVKLAHNFQASDDLLQLQKWCSFLVGDSRDFRLASGTNLVGEHHRDPDRGDEIVSILC